MEVSINKEQILSLVEQKGMSKAEFASRIGVRRQNLDYFFDSDKKDINTVIKISETLGIPFLELIGYEQPKAPSVYGCLYVHGQPRIVQGKKEILKLLEAIE